MDRIQSLFTAKEAEESAGEKRARITALALLHTASPKTDGPTRALLRGDGEISRYQDYADRHRQQKAARPNKEVCRYCEVAAAVAPRDEKQAWSDPINHGARITTAFDQQSNVSSAKVSDFQIFARGRQQAKELLDLAHPFRWVDADSSLFRETIAAESKNGRWLRSTETRADWKARKGGYLFESVSWAWNEFVSASVENILEISALEDHLDDGRNLNLSYDYRLERCLRSNFGVAFESGGLDVDHGSYSGSAVSLDAITQDHVPEDAEYHLRDCPDVSDAGHDNLDRLRAMGRELQAKWDDPAKDNVPYLVTLGASKSLRYTMPKNGPDEFRAFLNWTSPALLFTFLNLSICQPSMQRL